MKVSSVLLRCQIQKASTKKNITLLWEEHTTYFTSFTLRRILINHGFKIHWENKICSDGEDLIIVCVEKKNGKTTRGDLSLPEDEICAENFLADFNTHIDRIKKSLQQEAQVSTIYLYGANHIASNFLDLISPQGGLIQCFGR